MHRRISRTGAGIFTALISVSASAQVTIYVDQNATGPQDGTSWCTAYRELSAALANVFSGDTILVADGVYVPDADTHADPRDASFVIPVGVSVQGGRAGCGAPDPDAVDTRQHPTVLSGDLNGDDGPGFANYVENSYHVVQALALVPGVIELRDVTVTGGNADDTCCGPRANGGGLYISSVTDMRVVGCTFQNNAANQGGAIYNIGGFITVENCVLVHNLATYDFGNGGALYTLTGTAILQNNLFLRNHAEFFGGAVLNGSEMAVSHGTIVDNSTEGDGGGIHNANLLEISDSILWGNTAVKGTLVDETAQVFDASPLPSALIIGHANIQGWSGLLGGIGNFGEDPQFRRGPLDDFYLANGVTDPGPVSPCVDAGSVTAMTAGLDHLTTSTDESLDAGTVDLGYHRPITGLPAPLAGDADGDGDVDLRDVAALQGCFAGPDEIVSPACRAFEYDGDLDVDTDDWPAFSADLTGP